MLIYLYQSTCLSPSPDHAHASPCPVASAVHEDVDTMETADPIELAGLFQGDINLNSPEEFFDLAVVGRGGKARRSEQFFFCQYIVYSYNLSQKQ